MHPENLAQIHLDTWAMIIGIGEIGSALLFLFPKTNIYGAFLLSAYMGGAIIVHMTTQQSILFPSVILIIVWIGALIRNPQICRNCEKK